VALGNIGNCHVQFGQYAEAREIYRQQLALAERMGEKKGICLAWGNLAKASHRLGQEQRAREEVVSAIAVGEKMGLKYFLPEQYLLLAEVRLALGLLPEAEEAALKARQLARENGDPDDEKSARELLDTISAKLIKQSGG
jgi:tetratricopeptide (TPR) repeat protein